MVVFVSKYNHCLYDILARYTSSWNWNVEILQLYCSKSAGLRETVAKQFNIAFLQLPKQRLEKQGESFKTLKFLRLFDFIVLTEYI